MSRRAVAGIAGIMLSLLTTATMAADCFEAAANRYRVNATLLRAIAIHESNNRLDAISPPNRHGSRDYCAMQINEQHLPKLQQYGITLAGLLSDRCTCVHTGAWLLADEIAAVGDTWEAVARYNVGRRGSLAIGQDYAAKVRAVFERIAPESTPRAELPSRGPFFQIVNTGS